MTESEIRSITKYSHPVRRRIKPSKPMKMMRRISGDVIKAIGSERAYQDQKWPGHYHSVGEWILIMEKCLSDARSAWVSGRGDDKALHEIRQVVAVGVAAMEEHGAPLRENDPICSQQ